MSALGWLLNALLLVLLGGWLRGAYRQAGPAWRPWLLPALAWRLLATAAAARWPSLDAQHAAEQGQAIVVRLLAHPGQAFAQLQAARYYTDLTGPGEEVYRWSQTLYFDKLVGLLNLASQGVLWLNVLYFSLGCFAGCWSLVVALHRWRPAAAPAAGLAFLAWPTVLWWSAGLNKETVLIGSSAGLVALVLPLLYGRAPGAESGGLSGPGWLARLLGALLLAWVSTRVRYFFMLPLLGGLLALAAVQVATRRRWLPPTWPAQVGGVLLGLLALLGVAKAVGGELMTSTYFVHEVDLNYHSGLLTSTARPHIEYASWQPTVAGLLARAPLAVAETLTRPRLGEAAWPLYAGAGLENALLLLLLAGALLAALRGRPGPLPVALVAVLVVYCLLLAAFIGLSTPNLGTLNRYRSVLLPWLLWLVLQWVAQPRRPARR